MLYGEGFEWTAPLQPAVTSGCGVMRLRAHLLLSCDAGEKTNSKRHVNRMMFDFLCLVGGAMDMTKY